ncbi:MAG: HAD family hydrolase [Dehalococcoidia bacterium]
MTGVGDIDTYPPNGPEAVRSTQLKAIIFDYYETLVELSGNMRAQAFDQFASKVGVDLPAGEPYRHWREQTTRDPALRFGGSERPPLDGPTPPFRTFREVWLTRFRELFDHWGVDAPAEVGADAYRDWHVEADLYRDARTALAMLRKADGALRLAVLSDADHDFLAANLRRNGLRFDAVVSSEEVRVYKPHDSIFHHTCARLGVAPEEAMYVGDSPWADVAGARNAGLRAVWLNRRDTPWPDDIEPPNESVSAITGLLDLAR